MQLEKVRYKNKTIAYIHLHLDYYLSTSKAQLIDSLAKNIKDSASGYAGFRTRRELRRYLRRTIFDPGAKSKIVRFNFNKSKAQRIIKDAITSCHKVIPTRPIHVFVFPSFSKFEAAKMTGTSGFTPWQDVILIFINPLAGQWARALPKTIAHEYCHVAVLKYHKWRTLLDSIIFEGLAEHFREYTVGGNRAPWARALGVKQGKKLFQELKKNLYSRDLKLYRAVFFGNKNYPQWAGYSIGYQVVGNFIKNHPGLSWEKIIALDPKEILERSSY